jgi:proteasome lid subunit RPN8/RPN11
VSATKATDAGRPPIVMSSLTREQIEREGVAAYPNESCGILYGKDVVDQRGEASRVVSRLEPVTNEFEAGERYHRFLITPDTLMRAEKSAAAAGELVLGFYHSHPDHPARPSEYDREHGWPFYSYVIVAIAKRQPGDMTCWLLDETTEQFVEQEIVEIT